MSKNKSVNEEIIELRNPEEFAVILINNRKNLSKADYDQLEMLCTTVISLSEKLNPESLAPDDEFGGWSEFEYYLKTIRAVREISNK